MNRKNVLISLCLVLSSVIVTSIFWNLFSVREILISKYEVALKFVRISPSKPYHVSVTFFQNENRVNDIVIAADGNWHNTTLAKGVYLIKLYDANMGTFINKLEIYIANNIQLNLTPYI